MTTRFAAESAAVTHGMGLFETMLVRRGQVFDRDAHYQRMATSCATLGFPVPESRAFSAAVDRAAREVADEAGLRVLYAQDASRWRLVATTFAIPETTLRRRKGAHVITLDRSFVRSLPEHKLTSYAVSMIGLRRAIEAGADEGLFVDSRGHVLEGTTTNVFAVDGTTVITAKAGVLPGIVRAAVLARASRVIFRAPTIDELRAGSFLTSSLTGIAPIATINGLRSAGVPAGWLAGVPRLRS
jgi:branched-chain amino acid aminotransferase